MNLKQQFIALVLFALAGSVVPFSHGAGALKAITTSAAAAVGAVSGGSPPGGRPPCTDR